MNDNLNDAIKRSFDIATFRKLGRTLGTDDWTKVQEITKRAEQARDSESRRHKLEYPARLDLARKQIIDERASRHHTLKPRFWGADQFDKMSINQQAHKRVGQFHALQLSLIESREAKALERLAHEAAPNRAKDPFTRAADPTRSKPRSRD